jgi:hypothetical protein
VGYQRIILEGLSCFRQSYLQVSYQAKNKKSSAHSAVKNDAALDMNLIIDMKDFSGTFADEIRLCTANGGTLVVPWKQVGGPFSV